MTAGHVELVDRGGIPRLPGARCRGRHELFDPPLPGPPEPIWRRQAEALAECRRCPALAACRAWFDELPPRRRPEGVIAGQIHPAPTPSRRGRPRKAST
jgi:WhiB family redox-sensing transcriptional regulator